MIANNKYYCANCKHCVVFKFAFEDEPNYYYLKCKCLKKHWRTSGGSERFYKYCNIPRKVVLDCADYDEMGDLKPFLSDLIKSLPKKDEKMPKRRTL